MAKIPFNENELIVASELANLRRPETPKIPVFSYPCSEKEAVLALYRGEPEWALTGTETGFFAPSIIPDDIARGFVVEAERFPMENFGGKDMFGIEWEYIEVAGGSMVRPGKPFMEDANDWEKLIKFPDINEWDWEGSAQKNKEFLNNGKANFLWFLNGCWYERLVSFMDFEGAAMALIDEDQQDAVKALFSKVTDLYCDIVDKCCEAYGDGIVGFTVHDDWGSQRAPFFSPAIGREMIVPYMKRLTDHIKSKGKIADLHSCGHLEAQLANFVEAGWQSWSPMTMNDTQKMYEDFGDKILIHVRPDGFPEGVSEEEQEQAGEAFIQKFHKPGKYCIINSMRYGDIMTLPFRRGMYRASRLQE